MTQNIKSLDVSNSSHSPTNTANNFAWEERMAKLVGLDTQDYKPTKSNNNLVRNLEGNLKELDIPTRIKRQNPEEEPDQQVKTEQSIASNPFAKAALVGASTLIVVTIAGVFLSQIMGFGNSKKIARNNPVPQKRSQPATVPRLQQLETEVETLKTKLALAEQTDAIKTAQKELRTAKSPTELTPNSASGTKPRVTVRNKPRIQAPTPVRTVYVPRIVTRVVEAPKPKSNVTSNPAPKPISKTEKLLTPPPPPTPPVRAKPIVKVTPSPTPNPLAEWQRLAKLGSYGQVSLTTNNTTTDNNTARRASTSTTNRRAQVNNAPNVPPQSPQPQVTPQTNTPQITQSSQQNPKSVPVGNTAKAVLATALFGESKKQGSEDEDKNVFVIRLQEPLKSSDGEIALDKGTELLTQVNSISTSGMVQLMVTKVIINQDKKLIEKSLPENALIIKARKGKPLIAKNYPRNGSSMARMDAALFVLGGLGKASELLNRTESQVTTTATGSIVTNSNSDPNIGAGILEGGMKSVIPQIARRNQQAVSRMSRRTDLWFMKAGSKVEVYVNQTLQF